MATLRELIVKISANSQSFQSEIARASRMGADYYKTMENGGKRAAAATRESEKALTELNSQFGSFKQAASGMAGIFAGAFATTQLIHYADTWTQLNSRLKLASGSASDFSQNQKTLMDISQRTGTSLEANTNMFSRMSQAMKQLGYSSKDTANVTELVATSLRLSGAGAGEAASVITQFGQAMASGVLRGDEFNSIMENGGRFAKALADGLGVTIGQLRAMAQAGQLTSNVIMPALLGQLSEVRKEGVSMGATVSASMQRVENSFLAWVGTSNDAVGASSALSGALDFVSKNMENFANVAGALVGVGLMRFFGGLVSSAGQATIGVYQAQKAEVALAAAQVEGTKVATARARAAVYRAEQALVAARGTEAQAGAEARLAVAQTAAARNIEARAVAQTRLNTITSVSSRLGSGMLSAVGGIPGIVMGIAAAWMYVYEKNEQARQAALSYGESVSKTKLPSGLSVGNGNNADTINRSASAMRAQREAISDLNDEIAELAQRQRSAQIAMESNTEGSWSFNSAQNALNDITTDLNAKEAERDKLLKELNVTTDLHSLSLREAAAAANENYQNLISLTGQGQLYKKVLDGINGSLEYNGRLARMPQAPVTTKEQDTLVKAQQNAQLAGKTGIERVRLQTKFDLEAMGKTGPENATYAAQYSAAKDEEYKNNQRIAQGKRENAAATKELNAAQRKANEEADKAKRHAEEYTQQIERLKTEVEEAKIKANQGAEAANKYANTHNTAAKMSDSERNSIGKLIAEREKYNTIANQNERLDSLKQANILESQSIGISARELAQKQEITQAQMDYGKEINKSSESAAIHQKILDEIDAKYKIMAENAQNWGAGAAAGFKDWSEEATNYASQTHDAVKNAMGGLVDNMASLLNGSKANWKDWANTVLGSIEKILLNAAVVQGLQALGGAMGGGSGIMGSIGSFLSSAVGSAKGNVFSGGLSAYSNSIVSSPTVFAFAKGAGLMGEAGPEAVMPLARTSNGRLGVATMGGGGGIVINSTVNVNGNSSQSQTSGSNDAVGRAYDNVINQSIQDGIRRELKPGGMIWQAQQKR
ncbi:phage tail tape measure protein [Enterobacter huaxiensis]|uniref:phage tail tape measure protein n=1 Tax=Enterobacter huaxiensis TaxID=2494702 RepID=UPI0021757707|nr:phage tail tape measure protein [Enterobacter huaxiensis]MCS5452494.1 phage tail tape measure protein [Enterobacter huaxiensis]